MTKRQKKYNKNIWRDNCIKLYKKYLLSKSGILVLNTIFKLPKVKNQGRKDPLYLKTKLAIRKSIQKLLENIPCIDSTYN